MPRPCANYSLAEKLAALLWEVKAPTPTPDQEAAIIESGRIPRGFTQLHKQAQRRAAVTQPPPPKPSPPPYWTPERVEKALAVSRLMELDSLDAPLVGLDGTSRDRRGDVIADPSTLDGPPIPHELGPVYEAIERLPDRERFMVQSRFIDGCSLIETARRWATHTQSEPVSRERVRQILEVAIGRIRAAVGVGVNEGVGP